MAIMKSKEMRKISEGELEKKLSELRMELSKLKGSSAVGATVQNPGRVGELKRTIARILTIKDDMKRKISKEVR